MSIDLAVENTPRKPRPLPRCIRVSRGKPQYGEAEASEEFVREIFRIDSYTVHENLGRWTLAIPVPFEVKLISIHGHNRVG